MIASLNIVAKMFAKFAKTFDGLAATIVARRRRHVLILYLEAKYVKMDCKNEIYAKNWVRRTWTKKSQPREKSMVKVKLEMMSAMTQSDDVIRADVAE